MDIKIQDNGYIAKNLQDRISTFNKAAADIFGDCKINHFYYGENIDFIDLVLPGKYYGEFTITKKQVVLSGYRCTFEIEQMFSQIIETVKNTI